MPTNKKCPPPSLTVIAGSKADYEISLVKQIIEGQLTGAEFTEKVEARGQLTEINLEKDKTKNG